MSGDAEGVPALVPTPQQIASIRYIEEQGLEELLAGMLNSVLFSTPKMPKVEMLSYLKGRMSDTEVAQVVGEFFPEQGPGRSDAPETEEAAAGETGAEGTAAGEPSTAS